MSRRDDERDQRLAAIVEFSSDAIIGKDCDGLITIWNLGAERLYGYTAAEAIGRPVSVLVPPERGGEGSEILARVLNGQRIAHKLTERVCKDGSLVNVSVSVSPIYDATDRVIGASSIARDVTGLMRAQKQLALQAALLDEVDAAVILTDDQLAVRYWSRGAERLYGYTADEAIGRQVVDLIVPAHSRSEVMRLAGSAIAGEAAVGEIDARDQHGRMFPVAVRLRVVAPEVGDGDPAGIIGVSIDITSRRGAERAIRRHVQGEEEIANLGRGALRDVPLQELFDEAVRTVSEVLSADCALLLEQLPNARGFVVKAAFGWPGDRRGERLAEDRGTMSGYVVSSGMPVVVVDWDQEPRVAPAAKLLARGVRSSIAVLVGDPERPFGVLSAHYTRPNGVPADCFSFLDGLATVLAEAIQSRAAQETIRHQALHDELTGLPNRTLFLDRVAHALARNDRHPQPLAVLFIDLDHFKLVNDSLGHAAGDELLRLVAGRFASAIRSGDTLARLGGDEFAVLCEGFPSEFSAAHVIDHLLRSLEQPVVLGGNEHVASASVGIAVSTSDSCAADLLRDADAAMYQAKAAGRGRSELFDTEMRDRILGRVRIESALRASLSNGDDIYLHYQPLISLRNGRIVGAEALARWQHLDWGPVSPTKFIAVAEHSGLINELGAQVIHRAARESAAWHSMPDFAGIALNISARQLVKPDEISSLLTDAIAENGITPGFLTFEVTESTLIEHLDRARDALSTLKDLGVRLSLDDFGTGYSSISYLRELPLDSVKIDRSMISNITGTRRDAHLAAAIIAMSHALDLEVIAEGVETQEQAALLRELDCDLAQGYHFAKPMAPETLTALLHQQPRWLSRSPKPDPA